MRILTERFWSKVAKSDGCWEWTGCKQQYGHGLFRVNGVLVKAHRFSYEQANGPIPEGLIVRHKCDNPPCVRPDHLELGTRADNNRDRDERGRHVALKGEDHGNAVLTREQVEEIRSATGYGICASLAQKHGVSKNYIYQLRCRKDLWA
jgi:hypothetical protein